MAGAGDVLDRAVSPVRPNMAQQSPPVEQQGPSDSGSYDMWGNHFAPIHASGVPAPLQPPGSSFSAAPGSLFSSAFSSPPVVPSSRHSASPSFPAVQPYAYLGQPTPQTELTPSWMPLQSLSNASMPQTIRRAALTSPVVSPPSPHSAPPHTQDARDVNARLSTSGSTNLFQSSFSGFSLFPAAGSSPLQDAPEQTSHNEPFVQGDSFFSSSVQEQGDDKK